MAKTNNNKCCSSPCGGAVCCPGECIKNTPVLNELPKDYPEQARKRVMKKTKRLIKKLPTCECNDCGCGNDDGCGCSEAQLNALNNQLYVFSRKKEGKPLLPKRACPLITGPNCGSCRKTCGCNKVKEYEPTCGC